MSARDVAGHRGALLGLARLTGTERLSPVDGLGRVLAEDVVAVGALPLWDCSAMDGYAVRAEDVAGATPEIPVLLDVVGEAAAGVPASVAVGAGTAVRIMTGAPLPAGADTVVRQEDTDRGEPLAVRHAGVLGEYVRPAGDDVRAGDLVLVAGTLLGPAQLAAAVAAGSALLVVRRRPRVAVLSTGAELMAPGARLGPGQIHDSNSVLLAAAVVEAGGSVALRGSVPDDVAALRAVLAELDGQVDLVLTSGGVSVGDHDVVKAALAPRVAFVSVAMQPGKPQGAGLLEGGTPVICLPGNPVSASVSFEVFVRPVLRTMLGALRVDRPVLRAVAADGWHSPAGREQYMPVVIEPDASGDGAVAVRRAVAGGSGSHLVAGLSRAQGLAVVPAAVVAVRPGDALQVIVTDAP